MATSTVGNVRVWDAFVRIGHWLIVIGFFVAYFTEDDLLDAHVWAGYLVGTVVLLRIVWGFVGPEPARFRSFVYPPAEIFRYFVSLLRGRAERHLGHSPAGGAMVVLLLIGLAATVWSGLTVYAYDQGAGPLAPLLATETETVTPERARALSAAIENVRAGGPAQDKEESWEETHEICANLTLLLVILHAGGVLLASRVHHENLVRAMITGMKRKQP